MIDINTRSQYLAYLLAQWVCTRQQSVQRLATVQLFCEYNNIDASEAEQDYMLEHWHDYVTLEV